MALLEGFRVLDLTDQKGLFCGKVLADLGAEVIKIEKPGGDESRNIGPFYHNESYPEKSLSWFALNQGKKGITLNLVTERGQEIFQRLVGTANCVLESFPPGYLDGINLGYEALSQVNPAIVVTSITPFGQTGPYKDYKATDTVAMAMGGYTWLNGYPDRSPVSFSVPQAYSLAGLHAAAGTMIAVYHSSVTGEGQHVDVSIVESTIWACQEVPFAWDLVKWCPTRQGMARDRMGGGTIQFIWSCKDGYISFHVIGGKGGAQFMGALVEWMASEGVECEYLLKMDWESFDFQSSSSEVMEKVQEPIHKFFASHTKEELYREGIKRRVWLFPVSNMKDLLVNEQLTARGFWQSVEHPELNTSITYPGAFYRLSDATRHITKRAPLIGEHNKEILINEMGYSDRALIELKQKGTI